MSDPDPENVSNQNPVAEQDETHNNANVIWWCKVVVNRPKLMFGLTLGGHLLMCAITGVLFAANYDILPLVFNDLPMQINHDKYFLRDEADSYKFSDLDTDEELEPPGARQVIEKTDTRRKRSANILRLSLDKLRNSVNPLDDFEYTLTQERQWMADEVEGGEILHRSKRETNSSDDEDDIWERRYHLATIQVIYEVEGGNVFTKENLKTIAKLEYNLYNNETFQKRFCQLMSIFNTYQCRPFFSVLRVFDGSLDADLYDPSFTDVPGSLAKAYWHEKHRDTVKYFLSSNATITNSSVKSDITRSFLYYGRPYPEFLDRWEKSRAEEMKIWQNWAYKDLVPRFKNHYRKGLDDLRFVFLGNNLYYQEAFRQVFKDWYWLMGSVLFIFFFMWFQSSSLWITGWGLLSVVTCFVAGNLVYNLVFDFKFFGIFNVLAIFIVLGVGADDIFVFIDTWRLLDKPSFTLEQRLSECFRRAALTMLVTSLTTMVAFFVSGFSPLLSVSAFGVFAGTTILVNYISVIVFFPTVVITHHLYFEKNVCCCCRSCCCLKQEAGSLSYEEDDDAFRRNESTENLQKSSGGEEERKRSKVTLISGFFGGYFFNFVSHKIAKWIIISVCIGLTAGAIYFCSILESDNNNQIKVFRSHNVFEVARTKISEAFMENSGDRKVSVEVFWGLGLQDRSDCPVRRWDPYNWCEGKTVWDTAFTLDSPESQVALLNFCHELKNMTGRQKDNLHIRADPDDLSQNDVDCFIDDMNRFFKNLSSTHPNVSISIPITRKNLEELVRVSPDVFRSDAMDYISRPFEVAYQYWIKRGHGTLSFTDTENDEISSAKNYVGLRRIGRTNLHKNYVDSSDEFYQTKAKFAGIKITTYETSRQLLLQKGIALMEKWEDFINAKMKTMPLPLRNGWQTSGRWDWYMVQQSLARQGVLGIGIGLALSFVIIFIGTLNIIIAILSTLVLGCVSAFVIAVIPIGGWKLGLLESLNLCLVVGLSVDYIVHLAEAYHLSTSPTRHERTRDALMKVGISIISGAFTTLGASFFMFFAEILFFMQFGMFIFCTIGFSMLMSLFLFSALLCTFGPEGNQGSIRPFYVKLKRYMCECKKRKVTDQPTFFANQAYNESSVARSEQNN